MHESKVLTNKTGLPGHACTTAAGRKQIFDELPEPVNVLFTFCPDSIHIIPIYHTRSQH